MPNEQSWGFLDLHWGLSTIWPWHPWTNSCLPSSVCEPLAHWQTPRKIVPSLCLHAILKTHTQTHAMSTTQSQPTLHMSKQHLSYEITKFLHSSFVIDLAKVLFFFSNFLILFVPSLRHLPQAILDFWLATCLSWASPGGSVEKNPPADAGDEGLVPGSGRHPAGGNRNLFQYSCLENSTDRGAWEARVHGVTKSQTWLNTHSLNFHVIYLEKYLRGIF